MAFPGVHDQQAGGPRRLQQGIYLTDHSLHSGNVHASLFGVAPGAAEIALHVDDDQRCGVGGKAHAAGRWNPVATALAMRAATSVASSIPLAASDPRADESTPEGGTQSVRDGYMS